jgi:hypothetical protein
MSGELKHKRQLVFTGVFDETLQVFAKSHQLKVFEKDLRPGLWPKPELRWKSLQLLIPIDLALHDIMRQQQRQQQPEKQQLHNLSLALHEKEVENRGLKKALKILQYSNKQKTSLYPDLADQLVQAKEELDATILKLEQQTERAVGLHYQILRQQEDNRILKDHQFDFIKKIVELEVDIETHDVHFSQAVNHFKVWEGEAIKDALEGIDENKPNNNQRRQYDEGNKQFPTLDVVAKLISDYATLEARYKRDAAESVRKQKQLEQQNQTLKANLAVLEDRLASHNKSAVKFSLNESHNNNVYRRRVNDLETTNALLLLQQEELKKRLKDLQSSKLELGSNDWSGCNPKDKHQFEDERPSLAMLQEELAVTKKKMALLRMRAISYQVRNFLPAPNDNLMGQSVKDSRWNSNRARQDQYSSSDEDTSASSTLNDDDHDDESSNATAGLRAKVQDLKFILLRKDKELDEQRSQYQIRERELLAQLQDAYKVARPFRVAEPSRFFL